MITKGVKFKLIVGVTVMALFAVQNLTWAGEQTKPIPSGKPVSSNSVGEKVQSLTTESLNANVDLSFSQLKTYQADFHQVTWQQDNRERFQQKSQSTGRVSLAPPNLFRWDYQSPDKMQLLSDGEQFYHYDVALMQVSAKPLSEIADNQILLLLKQQKVSDVFLITPVTLSQASEWLLNDQGKQLKLPKSLSYVQLKEKQNSGERNQTLILGLSDQRQLQFFALKDDLGVVAFYFSKVTENASLPAKHFKLTVPDGVDILQNTP